MKVIVIGNGHSVTDTLTGDFVDSHDIIIRTNNAVVDGFENIVGSKRDILVHLILNSDKNLVHTKLSNKQKELMLCNKIIFTCDETDFVKNVECSRIKSFTLRLGVSEQKICGFTDYNKIFIKLDEITGDEFGSAKQQRPTTGIKAIIYAILTYPEAEITIAGIDALQGGYYWEKWIQEHKNITWHSESYELRALAAISKLHNVTVL